MGTRTFSTSAGRACSSPRAMRRQWPPQRCWGKGKQPTFLWFPPPQPHTPGGGCPSLPRRRRPLGHGAQAAPPLCAGHGGTRGRRTLPPNLRRSSPRSWTHHWMSSRTWGENGQGQGCSVSATQQRSVLACAGASWKMSRKGSVLLFSTQRPLLLTKLSVTANWRCDYYAYSV